MRWSRPLQLELEDLGVDLAHDPGDRTGTTQELEIRLGRLRVQLNNRIGEMVAANHPEVGVMDRNRLTQYFYSYVYRGVELQVLRRVQTAVADYRRFLVQRPCRPAAWTSCRRRCRTPATSSAPSSRRSPSSA